MHKIQEKEFTLDDFSCEYLVSESIANLEDTIKLLNKFRAYYNEYDVKNHFYIDNDSEIVDKKVIWEQMIQLLPNGESSVDGLKNFHIRNLSLEMKTRKKRYNNYEYDKMG